MVPPENDPLKGSAFLGPVNYGTHWLAVVDGRVVPHIKIFPRGDRFFITLDDRMGIEAASQTEIFAWLPLLANSMAVAAGYAAFGSNERLNPYNMMISGSDTIQADTFVPDPPPPPPPPPSPINAKPSLRLVESKPPTP